MNRTDRRSFLRVAGQLLATAAASSRTLGAAPLKTSVNRRKTRNALALERRIAAARAELGHDFPDHRSNGDPERYDPTWVCFSKGLPHEENGRGVTSATRQLWSAVDTQDPRAFEDVPLGGYIKLANPQAAFSFDLIGPDAQQLPIAPPPAFSSGRQAGEMVEMYWHALTRDVPFAAYDSDPTIAAACADLTAIARFDGPRTAGAVTPRTIFRGFANGLVGPYVSQFLWRDLPWTPIRVPQKIRVAAPGKDYLTSWADWLNIQNGNVYPVNDYEDTPRYIRNGRELGEYVHRDFSYQAFLGACLMLFRMSAPLDGGFRYQYSISQAGFVTLGASDILHVTALVANVALKASWFQKWVVHRRLRPEEYAARVHRHIAGKETYPLPADLLNARGTAAIRAKYGTALLPQAYPEGAPLHPSYPAGHAAIAGACATVLKACFAESFVIPNPQIPTEDGSALVPYRGTELAENIAFARDWAGIHWRSDGVEGIRLGEAVAIHILRELRMTSNELVDPFTLTTFDGKRIEIT